MNRPFQDNTFKCSAILLANCKAMQLAIVRFSAYQLSRDEKQVSKGIEK